MRILKENAICVVVDVQERLLPHIDQHEQLLANSQVLLQGLQALAVPILVTQQYTKGLGPTVEPLRSLLGDVYIEKQAFSCCDDAAFAQALGATARKQVLLIGIETHVCVLQTALDLLASGYLPVVIADCVSSRKPSDKETALWRLRQEGAVLSSYESILFELARYSGTPEFKAISKLVK